MLASRSNFYKILRCQRLQKPFFAFYCFRLFLLLPLYGEIKICNIIGGEVGKRANEQTFLFSIISMPSSSPSISGSILLPDPRSADSFAFVCKEYLYTSDRQARPGRHRCVMLTVGSSCCNNSGESAGSGTCFSRPTWPAQTSHSPHPTTVSVISVTKTNTSHRLAILDHF